MKRKNTSIWLAAVLLTLTLLPLPARAASGADTIDLGDSDAALQAGAAASGGRYSYDETEKIVTVHQGPVTVTGSTTERQIVVADGASVSLTLDGAQIDVSSMGNRGPINMDKAGACEVILAAGSVNTLRGGDNRPGILVPEAQKLTVTGTGALHVYGGPSWPGIGRNGGSGIIEIQNGRITATGGSNAAGIGGSYGFGGDRITITGGTVTATGNTAAGIGNGHYGSGQALLTFTGGSIQATTSHTPTNGHTAVTKQTIAASGGANSAVTMSDVASIAPWITGGSAADPLNQVYGIGGAFADSSGNCHLWLPDLATPQIAIQGGASSVVPVGGLRTLELSNSAVFNGSATFQWYRVQNAGENTGSTSIAGEDTQALVVDTSQTGSFHYYLAVTSSGITARSNPVTLTVRHAVSQTPDITAQPQSAEYKKGAAAAPLTVTAAVTDGGTLRYQWYENTAASSTGGTPVTGAVGPGYTPPTDTVGALYYYCVVTNTNTDAIDPTPVDAASGPAKITVTQSGTPGKTDASLSAGSANFDRNTAGTEHTGVTVTLTSGSYTLREITLDGAKLTEGRDYTVSGNRYAFSKECFKTLTDGRHSILFRMSGGTSPLLTVTVYDSSPKVWVNPFTDVKSGDWFYDDVAYVHMNGLFEGTAPTRFSPAGEMDRGMLVTVLGRLSGDDIPKTLFDMPFTDVEKDSYYAPYAAWAAKNGIIKGLTPDTFGGDTPLTRQQIAEILYRYAVYKGKAPAGGMQEELRYPDRGSIAGWAKNGAMYCQKYGIIKGREDGSFDPQGKARRCEVAAILRRFAEYAG